MRVLSNLHSLRQNLADYAFFALPFMVCVHLSVLRFQAAPKSPLTKLELDSVMLSVEYLHVINMNFSLVEIYANFE